MAELKYIKRTVALDGSDVMDPSPNSFFDGEKAAHTFIITATRGGEALMLTGAVSATFLNPHDAVIILPGTIVDGAAVVTLNNDCYALSGPFTFTIDVGGVTVYACRSRVRRRSSSTAYDPTGEISVATLSALIAEMRTATATANTAAATANAAANSAAGYVDAVAEYNVFNIPTTNKDGSTRNGVVTTVTGPYSIHAEGTATANWFHNMWLVPTFPDYLKPGDTIYLLCESTQDDVSMQLYTTTDHGTSWTNQGLIKGFTSFTIPANVNGLNFRAFAASGKTIDADIRAGILTNLPIDNATVLRYLGLLSDTELNNATQTGISALNSALEYTNKPSGAANSGYLFVANAGTSVMQLLFGFSASYVYKRVRNVRGVWLDWAQISGQGGNTYNNNYTFPAYTNTYTVTATPTITTDTNNYLASTGDTTDRTADIAAMLTQTGVCNLGPGLFVVNNLSMPKNTALRGSGPKTELRLAGTADGYAVKMNDYCQVSDLTISGASEDITLPETVGERHGILWQGNYTANHNGNLQPKQGLVSDVAIRRFTGGGITCYDTGYSTYNNLCVVNAQIRNCGAGLNIAYWSEFHKFTNCRCFGCLYGCINNGGNNMFVNCDFSSCQNGFLMDNSQGQSPNNAHGACIGCLFHHTANNTGVGIKILNCDNGYIFDGCQIGFSRTIIEDSVGIVFANMFFGQATNCDITITGGGAITFANNMHIAKPPITVTNNSNVRFINCYVASTGAAVSA